ncbi:MAG TPA: RagB/SusD family nutrient uptake outer membrane protein [Flavisolibacter sp.]|nr:RagB/SusD family nutrient uptake outer membrane protein [Flavisolibacter sp.]
MKQRINYFLGVLLAAAALSSCKKNFLERPPLSSITDANFYKTDEQLMAATAPLYNAVWFDYNDAASWQLGDFRGGSAYDAWYDNANSKFNTTPDNQHNQNAWRAFFNVVAQSNLAIYNISRFAGASVSAQAKSTAIAEARFMRALAYRYLVMNWGAVPIIENNLEHLNDTTIRKNTVPSVWRFITREMRAAAADLPTTAPQPGRLTKWSAEGMLARFYLTRSGVESSGGVRKQEFLDSAKYFAADVINNSSYKLLDNYEDLFRWNEKTGYRYDNNSESLFELQWVFSGSSAWGTANSMPEQIAYSGEIAYSGWGGSKGATWWMISQYDGFILQPDGSLKGRTIDQRLHATFMLPGFTYPDLTKKSDKTKFVFPFTGTDANFASFKKYVIGGPDDLGANASSQHYPNNTYMMRLAEMYLIYAEAAIGNNNSTTDATAVAYFNKVHQRAGLPAWTVSGTNANGPLTLDVVFSERFKEFAAEGSTWYDIVSLHYWNPTKALALLNTQDRGLFFAKPDNTSDPSKATEWTITKTSWFTPRLVTATEGNFVMPIPAIELSQAPNLQAPAVDYP